MSAEGRLNAAATVLTAAKARGMWDKLNDRERAIVWREAAREAEAVLGAVDRYDREHGTATT